MLSTAGGAVLFMLRFIVSLFTDRVQALWGEQLPLMQAVVRLSTLVGAHGLAVLTSLVGLVFAVRGLSRIPTYRYALSLVLLRVPVLGTSLRGVYLSRLCGSRALLTGAHVQLLQVLALARQLFSFEHLT